MPGLGSEKNSVQGPFLRYAQECGWTYVGPDEAVRLRGGEGGIVLRDTFADRLHRLNPGLLDQNRVEELVRRIERVLPRIEGNEEAWQHLKGLKTIFVPEESRERNVTFVDKWHWDENAFHVTDELTFDNGTQAIRLDLVFFVNGIPVLAVETKGASRVHGIEEGIEQIRRYHREGPELLAVAQVHAVTHLVRFFYGPTWNVSRKSLFNWKEEATGDFESLVKTFIAPKRIVRMLHDFIMFVRQDDELTKIILRPHQMRAVDSVLGRASDPEKRRGLVWHTQGSGKTYTMITVAEKLIELEQVFENPTVLMLIDRNELSDQLTKNLESCGIRNAIVAESKRHLQDLLASDTRGLIVSMIHKFEGIPENINTRENVFVLVDEAHRTTGGDLGNYLMGALPNATYIGFTGTPIDRTAHGKGTFKVFGADDPHGYLDKYSIAESIDDGTTVPLNYTLAPNELQVDRETLETDFLDLAEAEGISDIEELNAILDRAVRLRTILKKPERIDAIAKYVAEHYLKTVEPMGYKAFLVAVDRQACALYKDAIDKYLPPEYSRVVYSPGHNDRPLLRQYHLDEDEEKKVRKAFRKPEELPKVLIVTEKLLTGFDAPILYCMYLDKPMRDHVLLQAIARVNRPYEDEFGHAKPAGFVLDFVGIFDRLEKALAFDAKDVEDVQSVVKDIALLKEHFAGLMVEARRDVLQNTAGVAGDKAVERIIERYRDEEERNQFYAFFRELSSLYEIISPDAFLAPYIEDYNRLAEMFRILRSAYEQAVFADRELMRKTERLVQEHTISGKIEDPIKVYEISQATLRKIAESDDPDTVKVFNLVKSLHVDVEDRKALAPYLLSIGDRTDQIIEEYQRRQITTQEALKKLEEIVREVIDAEKERIERNIPADQFAVYWLLKRREVPDAECASHQMGDVFVENPHWTRSEAQERSVRQKLYAVLIRSGIKGEKLTDIAQQVMDVMKQARS